MLHTVSMEYDRCRMLLVAWVFLFAACQVISSNPATFVPENPLPTDKLTSLFDEGLHETCSLEQFLAELMTNRRHVSIVLHRLLEHSRTSRINTLMVNAYTDLPKLLPSENHLRGNSDKSDRTSSAFTSSNKRNSVSWLLAATMRTCKDSFGDCLRHRRLLMQQSSSLTARQNSNP